MAANRIKMCFFDARKNAFNKECVIYVINRLLGAEIVTEANFDNAKIKSRRPAPGDAYDFFLIVGGSEYKIPLFSGGTQYGNSSGNHINSKRAALPAEFNNAHVELVKAIMRRGAWGGEGYLYQLLGNPGNYEPDPRFTGKVEVLMRNLENLEEEEAMAAGGGGGGGGPGYMNALQAVRANVNSSARIAYGNSLNAARREVREAAMAEYIRALGAAGAAVRNINDKNNGMNKGKGAGAGSKKHGGKRQRRSTRRKSKH